uniref:Bloodthirsty-related gene family, member 2 n=2 Tax=Gadus morhua TaxID=8049 RepID=A0A8C4Z8W7_GADMO
MASTVSLLSEKSFLCFLCRDVFINPVTIPCGHSFCKTCLCHSWSKHQSTFCPQCKRVFSTRPDLSINRILADVSENYRKNRPLKPPVEKVEANVGQMIQERQHKIERLKYSVQLLKTSCLREVRESQKVFSALVHSMEKSHKWVVAAIEEREQEEERKVEMLIHDLEQEIRQLRSQEQRKEALKYGSQVLHTSENDDAEPDVPSCASLTICPTDMKDWSKVTMETDPCVAITRRALSEMMDMLKEEVNRLSKSELKRIQKYTADVNLSPKTAHPSLSISEDRKQVRHTDKLQEVPDNPKRFDRVANILGRESFGAGRYYWEVEVGDKLEWSIGVVRQTVNRKGKFTVCPANGFWTLSLKPGGQYVANSSPPAVVGVEEKPRKVAVFLDYGEGHVSFYCVESGVHMFTFRDSFTDRLHPFFSPGRLHGGRNAAPLVVTSSCCSI